MNGWSGRCLDRGGGLSGSLEYWSIAANIKRSVMPISRATTNWAAGLRYLNQDPLIRSHTCRCHFFDDEFSICWRLVGYENRGGVNPVSAGAGGVV
ncbi:hypothetical protein EKK58_10670 [Candidatus Dependentiae bacterium]|nr:MAG: hypothetical protein EKK58_10670 [Candidatus Dependentiae bacterium]